MTRALAQANSICATAAVAPSPGNDSAEFSPQASPQHDREQAVLEVAGATFRYGDAVALDNVSVSAKAGEFLTILGESGSGKTTLLRLISGLEQPSEVQALRLNGREVRNTPAYQRDCTTVFQSYALFPHMSVGENVAYGLRVRGVAERERVARATEALALVRLSDKFDRRIHQLSGGERQRVALARALVTRPALLLLDEPLGALDEKLRLDMQVELLDLQKRLGLTFVYITHSQEEALTMSDRIVLLRKGRIEQEGTPQDLFDRPVSGFAASFMGYENLIDGVVEAVRGHLATVRVGSALVSGRWTGTEPPAFGGTVIVGLRAERLRIDPGGPFVNAVTGTPGRAIYKGKYLDQLVETPLGQLVVRLWQGSNAQSGTVTVAWHEDDCVVMRP